MTPHHCALDWCTANLDGTLDTEHYGKLLRVAATGSIDATSTAGEELPTVAVQLWFDADVEAAPQVLLGFDDGDAHLQLHEAILLHEYLGRAINAGIAGTAIDPARVIETRGTT